MGRFQTWRSCPLDRRELAGGARIRKAVLPGTTGKAYPLERPDLSFSSYYGFANSHRACKNRPVTLATGIGSHMQVLFSERWGGVNRWASHVCIGPDAASKGDCSSLAGIEVRPSA